ncbi:MAG: AAA family ATPase, partial [Candidatus Limnocylindrales bacterium]
AHPEVFNMLLQILEDGHLSDSKGRRVDFRNTIIIMTSNVGAKDLLKDTSLGFRPVSADEDEEREAVYERMRSKVLEQLKSSFRPEFLNRIDSQVVFRSLTVEEIRKIVDLLLARVRDQLQAQQIALTVTEEAKDHVIKLGYDVDYGARPLRRVIQNMVEDPLAEALLIGSFKAGDTVKVDRDEDSGLSIEAVEEKAPVEAV